MNLTLEIARKTMMQAQLGMSVSMNNLTFSKIPGYTRQRVNLTSSSSIPGSTSHLVGTGANVAGVDRLRSTFHDRQFRDNVGIYAHSGVMSSALKKVESIFGSIDGDTGVKTNLNGFFEALEELSKAPEGISMKQILKDSGVALAESLNQINSNLNKTKEQYASFIQSKVSDINSILKDINVLNDEIGKATAMGQTPNDMLDERDKLLDELSANIDVSIVSTTNNKVNIIANGVVLIQDGYANQLNVTVSDNYSVAVGYENGDKFESKHGELGALIQTSSDVIPRYQEQIDLLARDFISAFNNIMTQGKDSTGAKGLPFFEGTDAGSIKVSSEIVANPDKIVTSSDGSEGGNDIILKLIELKDSKTIDGKFSVMDYYDKISSNISAEASSSTTKEANYKYVTDEIYKMRANETGVNEDEEILAVGNYQKTYAAAAKVVQTLDEMFNSLLQSI